MINTRKSSFFNTLLRLLLIVSVLLVLNAQQTVHAEPRICSGGLTVSYEIFEGDLEIWGANGCNLVIGPNVHVTGAIIFDEPIWLASTSIVIDGVTCGMRGGSCIRFRQYIEEASRISISNVAARVPPPTSVLDVHAVVAIIHHEATVTFASGSNPRFYSISSVTMA